MNPTQFVPDEPGKHIDAIRHIQRKLASLDPHGEHKLLLPLHADYSGTYDPDTSAAIKAFQEKNKLEVSGVCDEKTWQLLNEQAGSTFMECWQYELDTLNSGRVAENQDAADRVCVTPVRDELAKEAHERQLVGLALSGGGVRSATFSLGVLQALAELHMLKKIDYLSTVSGGGYIGAWFSKWLKQLKGNIVDLERELAPGSPKDPVKREPDQIKFLRQYSNYLTPKVGLFSADTWALAATYVRNTMLNLAILVALLAAALVLPRLVVALVDKYANYPRAIPVVAIVAALWSVFWIANSISTVLDPSKRRRLIVQSQKSVIGFIVVPLMLAAFLGSIALWQWRAAISASWEQLWGAPHTGNRIVAWLLLGGVAYFLSWAAGWVVAMLRNSPTSETDDKNRRPGLTPTDIWREGITHLVCAIGALAVGTLLVIITTSALYNSTRAQDLVSEKPTIAIVTFGAPLLLSLFGITMMLLVGLIGHRYTDKSREWWARQSGWTAIVITGWLGLTLASLYAPPLLDYIYSRLDGWFSAILGSAWFATVVAGVKAGKSNATGAPDTKSRLAWLAVLAPPVFTIGAVCLISTLVVFALQQRLPGPMTDSPVATLIVMAMLFTAAGVLLAWRVDINKFSLHMMYRNRLARAYLGASNPDRHAHPFTGFDPTDDIHFDELLANGTTLQRPIHIVNTALNLVHGDELAWQMRKAGNFIFTPAFCGFELPAMAAPGGGPKLAHQAMRGGFRSTAAYRPKKPPRDDEERGVNLGMAMAVSGAAASPNMGYHSSPALAFLMTLFNVRLGRWFVNPTRPIPKPKQDDPRPPPPRTSPKLGIWHLLCELFGLTNANSDYVYLSDGGHFENLGVYELVRRRCRLIVVVDAGEDRAFDFGDLGNAIRKCGTDLHIEIEIKVGRIDLQQPSQFSKAHCVTGKIRYDKVDANAPAGTLLYIKPSLLGSEYADILNYRKTNKAFPHQSTGDSWFDETQFEAYRALGYHIANEALGQAVADWRDNKLKDQSIGDLCDALHAIWGRTDGEAGALQGPGRPLMLVQYRGTTQRRKSGAHQARAANEEEHRIVIKERRQA